LDVDFPQRLPAGILEHSALYGEADRFIRGTRLGGAPAGEENTEQQRKAVMHGWPRTTGRALCHPDMRAGKHNGLSFVYTAIAILGDLVQEHPRKQCLNLQDLAGCGKGGKYMVLPLRRAQGQDDTVDLCHAVTGQHSRYTLSATLVLPAPQPEEHTDQDGENRNADVEIFHEVEKLVPVLAELVSNGGDDAHPQHRAQEVEQGEALPGHAQHTRQRPGEYSQPENEAREEDGDGAVLLEETFAASDGGGIDAKDAAVAIEKGAAAAVADKKAEIVPESGGAHSYEDDVGDLELVLRIGEKAGQQQDGFTRHGDAGVLQQQCDADRPVTVVDNVIAQGFEDGPLLAGDLGRSTDVKSGVSNQGGVEKSSGSVVPPAHNGVFRLCSAGAPLRSR